MKKFPKPWYRPSRGVWYVTIDGKQINLGPDKEAAFQEYKRLLNQPRQCQVPPSSVAAIVDAFLEWTKQHRASDTYEWYRYRLELFCQKYPDLQVAQLRPCDVQQWVDATGWESGGKRNGIRAIQRALTWAEEQGYVERSPLAHMTKPKGGKKEVVVPKEHYQKMLELTRDEEFRDLLIVTWDTGCRPQESLRVEARHVERANERWVIPRTPGKPDMRVVYMTDSAMQITEKLMGKHPEGPIFRNKYGRPWTTDAVNCHFTRLKEKMGVRYSLYALRHTWITRLLEKGVDSLTVAFLAGHKDPSMLAKHYAHLTHNPKHLLNQAKKSSD